jgi:general nucleoside transport system ATP-binding protein
MTNTPRSLLSVERLSRSFGNLRAVDTVDLEVGVGEIHALLGENGAGKSTLVKMIYGVLRADSGTMNFDGDAHAPSRPSDARRVGIGMVFQHFSLFDALTVTENVALGISPALAKGDLAGRIVEVGARYGLHLVPDRRIGTLSVGERQRVEIVRCLLQNPRLIIMDEPTSVLTPQEVETLFKTLRTLAAEGRSILYISHKLDEIRALCSCATVMRAGKVVARCDPRQETSKSLAEMMLGTSLKPVARNLGTPGEVRLKLDRLTLAAETPFGVSLDAISLDVRAGEIVGIAGVAGNGQDELMRVLIGERMGNRADAILVDGLPMGHQRPQARRVAGLGCLPEERLGHGAVPGLSLVENTLLTAAARRQLISRGLIDWAAATTFAEDIVKTFDVRTRGVTSAARSLSGGNLQKFLVGREVLQVPNVLVVAQPTWGVDAGAASAIHQQLFALARAGAAIVVISQDLDELFQIASRIAVIAGGRLTAARATETLTAEIIGVEMGGGSRIKIAEGAAHA